VTELTESSIPRLAAGCKWGGTEGEPMVLFPEGAIRVEGSGLHILQLCDGNRTAREIIEELQANYSMAKAEKIRADVVRFLDQLREKRIVDF
jgi:coenzyme PQQ biosynthesis protein PqqD